MEHHDDHEPHHDLPVTPDTFYQATVVAACIVIGLILCIVAVIFR